MRTCKTCGIQQELEEFPWNKKSKGYRSNYCALCKSKKEKEYRLRFESRHPGRMKKQKQESEARILATEEGRKRKNEQQQALRAKHPERAVKYSKDRWQRIKNDPEYHREILEYRRTQYFVKNGRQRNFRSETYTYPPIEDKLYVDIGPFREFMQELKQEHGTYIAVAHRMDIPHSKLLHLLKRDKADYYVLDEYLTREGTMTIDELYPGI